VGEFGLNAQFFGVQTHFSPSLYGLNCRKEQVPHVHKVIGSGRERKNPPNLKDTRYLVLHNMPTVFIQPKTSSIRFRLRWLTS